MTRILATSVAALAVLLSGCGGTADSTESKDGKGKPEPKAETFEAQAYEYARENIAKAKDDDEAGITANEDLAREFHAEYEVHVDASRTMTIEVAGVFQPVTSVEDAPAGKAEIETITSGKVKATNTSDGRTIEDFNHSLVIQLAGPELCGSSATCLHELSEIQVTLLEPGETDDDIALGFGIFQAIGGDGEINEADMEAAAKAVNEGILMTQKTSVTGGDYLKVNGEACPGNRVIFWSEDPEPAKC